jgi:nitroreductase
MQIIMREDKKVRSNERYDVFKCLTCQNCVAVCPREAITIEGDYRVSKGFWKNAHLFSGPKTLPKPFSNADRRALRHIDKHLTETERVILKRRSVRLYKKLPVERDKIERIIEAGRFAPSAGNNQPWKFIVIQRKEVIDEINEQCKRALRKAAYLFMPHDWLDKKVPGTKAAPYTRWQQFVIPLLVALKPGDVEPRVRGGVNTVTSDPAYHIFFNAPALIILTADRRGIGSIDLDTGICGQNMVLAAHAMGLGTCWVSLIRGLTLYPKYMRELGITDPFTVITSITVGYPRGTIDRIVAREPARVEWIE